MHQALRIPIIGVGRKRRVPEDIPLFPRYIISYTLYLATELTFHHFECLLNGASVFQVIGAMLKDTTINIDAMPCKGTPVDRQPPQIPDADLRIVGYELRTGYFIEHIYIRSIIVGRSQIDKPLAILLLKVPHTERYVTCLWHAPALDHFKVEPLRCHVFHFGKQVTDSTFPVPLLDTNKVTIPKIHEHFAPHIVHLTAITTCSERSDRLYLVKI